jgi:hypothetical protein
MNWDFQFTQWKKILLSFYLIIATSFCIFIAILLVKIAHLKRTLWCNFMWKIFDYELRFLYSLCQNKFFFVLRLEKKYKSKLIGQRHQHFRSSFSTHFRPTKKSTILKCEHRKAAYIIVVSMTSPSLTCLCAKKQ